MAWCSVEGSCATDQTPTPAGGRCRASEARGVNIDGGWAEYTVAAADAVVPLPPGIPFEQACVIPDAVSTPWTAITSGANVRPPEAVAVWGVGGLAAHAVQLLRMVGACPVIAVDPLPTARERALRLGADTALDPADPEFATLLRAAAGTGGVAAAFDFAGVPAARDQALAALAEYGRQVLVGLTDQPFTIQDNLWFCRFRQRVLGHYGSRPRGPRRPGPPGGHAPSGPLRLDQRDPSAGRRGAGREGSGTQGGQPDPAEPHTVTAPHRSGQNDGLSRTRTSGLADEGVGLEPPGDGEERHDRHAASAGVVLLAPG